MSEIVKFHEQTKVSHRGEIFEVDSMLVPILTELWKKRITTYWSCQGDSITETDMSDISLSYILMKRDRNALRLVSHIEKNLNEFKTALKFTWLPDENGIFNLPKELRANNYSIEYDDGDFGPRLCIRFPFEYIPHMKEFLSKQNSKTLFFV